MINQRGERRKESGDLRRVSERRLTRVNGARSRFGAGCREAGHSRGGSNYRGPLPAVINRYDPRDLCTYRLV